MATSIKPRSLAAIIRDHWNELSLEWSHVFGHPVDYNSHYCLRGTRHAYCLYILGMHETIGM